MEQKFLYYAFWDKQNPENSKVYKYRIEKEHEMKGKIIFYQIETFLFTSEISNSKFFEPNELEKEMQLGKDTIGFATLNEEIADKWLKLKKHNI